MAPQHRDSALTSLQIPSGRTILIDNRMGSEDAVSTIISFAKRGAQEGYTVISDCIQNDKTASDGIPRLHICTLLRPGKHTDHAGIVNAMGTIAASHAIERNSETRTAIRWLGDIYPEKRRLSLFPQKRIATVYSQSLLLPSGFLDYMILHAVIDMPTSRFPVRMVDAVSRIFTARPVTNADHLTHAFLNDFFTMYDALLSGAAGAMSFWMEYRSRSMLIGKRIRFRDGKKRRRGRVLTVSDTGALLVIGKGGKHYEITAQWALS